MTKWISEESEEVNQQFRLHSMVPLIFGLDLIYFILF